VDKLPADIQKKMIATFRRSPLKNPNGSDEDDAKALKVFEKHGNVDTADPGRVEGISELASPCMDK